MTARFVRDRKGNETFQKFVERIGKVEVRRMIENLMQVPSYEADRSFYSDWGDPREYSIGDMGTGECAGEVISVAQFDLADAERLVFEGQLQMDNGNYTQADALAYKAMLQAAVSLIKTQYLDVRDDPATIVREFRTRFYETELLRDRYAGSKFAQYLFNGMKHLQKSTLTTRLTASWKKLSCFIEAAYACHDVITEQGSSSL